MTEGLVTWLLLQVAEDERKATAKSEYAKPEASHLDHPAEDSWHTHRCGWRVGEGLDESCTCGVPARVLAECDAKRERIKWYIEVIGGRDLSTYGQFGSLRDDPSALAVTLAVEAMRLDALPYADRPGYRQEWRPS
jgi:hypothetical protein